MAVSLFSKLIDLVFPLECLACGREGFYCCAGCLSRIRLIEEAIPHRRLPFERVHAAAAYANPLVRTCLAHWKLEGLALARDPIEGLVWRWHDRFGRSLPEGLVIVPVPLHASKMNERGFNQAAEIAGWLRRMREAEVIEALVRHRKTMPQIEVEDRSGNVGEAFAVSDPSIVCGRDILLVDDIWTTGSTMGECAKALKAAGARRVFGFAVATSLRLLDSY